MNCPSNILISGVKSRVVKKSIALGLILIFLFNIIGYHGFYAAMRYQIRARISQQLDDGSYSLDQAITFKTPLSLPYPMGNTDSPRIDGDFEFNGEFFKLAKQTLENDTLYIVLVKNSEEKRLLTTLTDYVKLSIDHAGDTKHSTLKLHGNIVKDFTTGMAKIEILSYGILVSKEYFVSDVTRLLTKHFPEFSPPPEFIG